jgi:hypothetical protein
MRSIFFLLLISSTSVFAQKRVRLETPYNSFINSPTVLWAINANDTLRFSNPNLSALLVQKMYKGEIKTASIWDNDSKEENELVYKTIAENDALLNGDIQIIPAFDSSGNKIETKVITPDTISALIKLHQKFYIENNKLLSYISCASPIKTITTAHGLVLGNTQIFSTAFNSDYKTNSTPKDKVFSLGTTKRTFFIDSMYIYENCKETLGRNLIETLWPSIEKDKIALYSLPENKKTTFEYFNKNYLQNIESLEVPIYDENGNNKGTKRIENESKPNIINKIIITQEWFYNDTKNIVFCKIPSAILSIQKLDMGNTSYREIKIVF